MNVSYKDTPSKRSKVDVDHDKIIGIFIPALHDSARRKYIGELNRLARQHGYCTICFSSYTDLYIEDNFDRGEESIYDLAKSMKFAGMIVYKELIKSQRVNDMLIRHGKELGVPVFTVDTSAEGATVIKYDYENSFGAMVDHVIEVHGCRDIYLISGMRDNSFSRTRELAYKDSLEKHGIKFESDHIYYGQFWSQPAEQATREIIAHCGDKLPDAIVCANDAMAIAACCALEQQGIVVPNDIIVTGFDGIDRTRSFFPTICTAEPDYKPAAQYVLDTIISCANGSEFTPCEKVFGCALHIGHSCGCEKVAPTAAGKINSDLFDEYSTHKIYTSTLDRMVLRYNNGSDILGVLKNIASNFCEVIYAGLELYLDPTAFGDPLEQKCTRVLATRLQPADEDYTDPHNYTIPFKCIPDDYFFSDDLFSNIGSVVLVPIHCQDKVYGYLAAELDYTNEVGERRLYDFSMRLNFLLSSIESTTKLKEVIGELDRLFVRDQLTNLFNRHGYYREADRIIDLAKEKGCDLAVISADLDGLKYINDNYGHSEGDFAITAIADLLKKIVGNESVCARFGGDEYLALCVTDRTEEEFESIFRSELRRVNEQANKPYPINASFGIEMTTPERAETEMDQLINLADNKMFEQKRESRFSREMRRATAQGSVERLHE